MQQRAIWPTGLCHVFRARSNGGDDALPCRLTRSISAHARHLTELMDEPCSREVMRACLRDLAKLNRWFLGYRPLLSWLDSLRSHAGKSRFAFSTWAAATAMVCGASSNGPMRAESLLN